MSSSDRCIIQTDFSFKSSHFDTWVHENGRAHADVYLPPRGFDHSICSLSRGRTWAQWKGNGTQSSSTRSNVTRAARLGVIYVYIWRHTRVWIHLPHGRSSTYSPCAGVYIYRGNWNCLFITTSTIVMPKPLAAGKLLLLLPAWDQRQKAPLRLSTSIVVFDTRVYIHLCYLPIENSKMISMAPKEKKSLDGREFWRIWVMLAG